jgi:hypothetical protein
VEGAIYSNAFAERRNNAFSFAEGSLLVDWEKSTKCKIDLKVKLDL